jgi:hypothetical protein
MTRWKVRRFGIAGKYWWNAYRYDMSGWVITSSWEEAMAHVERETV